MFLFQLRILGLLVAGKQVIKLGSGKRVGSHHFAAHLTQRGRCGLNRGRIVGLDGSLQGLVGGALAGSRVLLRGGLGSKDQWWPAQLG